MKTILLLAVVLGWQRNIFQYVEERRPPKPKAAVARPGAPAALVTPEPSALEPLSACGGPPLPFQFPMRYIGSFGPGDNLIAVLAGDPEVVTVRAGDPLGDGYVVGEVSVYGITLIRGEVTRRLALAE